MLRLTPKVFSAIMVRSSSLLAQKKYERALDLVNLIQEDIDCLTSLSQEKLLIFYNNIAVLYHNMTKPNLCSFYMNKAHKILLDKYITESRSTIGSKDSDNLNLETSFKIFYNLAISKLFALKPLEAFYFFQKAVLGMQNSPLIWLRLAECCIFSHRKDQEGCLLASGTVMCGPTCLIILNSDLYKRTTFRYNLRTSYDQASCLGFASICLQNALTLLKAGDNKLREAILADSSYVHLTIGSPEKAYKNAKMLFENTAAYKYKCISALYLAESLVLLNRVEEAIEIVNPEQFSSWVNLKERTGDKITSNIDIRIETDLTYSLAVALTLMNKYSKAMELLAKWKVTQNKIPLHIIGLVVYIQLVLGKVDTARIIIKQHSPHLFQKSQFE